MVDLGFRAMQSAEALVKRRIEESLEISGNPKTVKKKRMQVAVAKYIKKAVEFYNGAIKFDKGDSEPLFRVVTRCALSTVIEYSRLQEVQQEDVEYTIDYIRFVLSNYVNQCGVASKEMFDEYISLAMLAEDDDDIIALLDKIEMEVADRAEV